MTYNALGNMVTILHALLYLHFAMILGSNSLIVFTLQTGPLDHRVPITRLGHTTEFKPMCVQPQSLRS